MYMYTCTYIAGHGIHEVLNRFCSKCASSCACLPNTCYMYSRFGEGEGEGEGERGRGSRREGERERGRGGERERKREREGGREREREGERECLRKIKNLWTHLWPLPAGQFLNGWPLNFHRGILLTGWM